MNVKAEVLFELSWEVCNKVGGIYTVLVTKAALMQEHYKNYFCIGPYFKEKILGNFEEEQAPANIQHVLETLKAEGIPIYYGTWRIKGEPKTFLVDYRSLVHRKNEFKAWMWEHFGIDSIQAGWDFEEPLLWSWACALLMQRLARGPFERNKIVSHHHEWMAGLSLLALKGWKEPIKTTFTTHATILGRSLAGRQENLYAELDRIDPEQRARQVGITEKFTTERACAHAAEVFTTVSEITSYEAEKILGRKPDVLTLNGVDVARFPTIEETSIKHVTSRERLREYLTYHFFPYYHNFDLENNLIFCISGRYEYENKGINVFIEALGRLNKRLQEEQSQKTITTFFWIPGGTKGIRQELMENKNYYKHIRGYVEWHSKDILKGITQQFITSENPEKEECYSKEFMKDMKKEVLHFRRYGNPPICTHYLYDENNDPILRDLRAQGLDNKEDDKVKVISYPIYLDGNDGLLNFSYYEALSGCHFAIYPSYYEPWGYTPLEAAAMGVPTLTTDLSGFGKFISGKIQQEHPGIYVLSRAGKSREETVQELYDQLYAFSQLDHSERVQNKINAKQLSNVCDWKSFVKFYIEAHNLALER